MLYVTSYERKGLAMMGSIADSIQHLPRTRRRLMAFIGLAGYPLAYGLLAAGKAAGLNRWLTLSLFLFMVVVTVAFLFVAYGYARGRADGGARGLDERDRELRQQAYAASHRLLALMLVLGAAAVEVYVTSRGAIRLDATSFAPVLLWVAVYIPALPSVMLAWVEPDFPGDD